MKNNLFTLVTTWRRWSALRPRPRPCLDLSSVMSCCRAMPCCIMCVMSCRVVSCLSGLALSCLVSCRVLSFVPCLVLSCFVLCCLSCFVIGLCYLMLELSLCRFVFVLTCPSFCCWVALYCLVFSYPILPCPYLSLSCLALPCLAFFFRLLPYLVFRSPLVLWLSCLVSCVVICFVSCSSLMIVLCFSCLVFRWSCFVSSWVYAGIVWSCVLPFSCHPLYTTKTGFFKSISCKTIFTPRPPNVTHHIHTTSGGPKSFFLIHHMSITCSAAKHNNTATRICFSLWSSRTNTKSKSATTYFVVCFIILSVICNVTFREKV